MCYREIRVFFHERVAIYRQLFGPCPEQTKRIEMNRIEIQTAFVTQLLLMDN